MTKRSQAKELIDLGPDFYDMEEYKDCLKKLFQINKWLGIFRSTKKLLSYYPQNTTLLDIGCGNGLFLLNLSHYFPNMQMHGIDLNKEAISEAQKSLEEWQKKSLAHHLSFQIQNLDTLENDFDIILATLLCHHLNDQELILFLKSVYDHARKKVIIHDLHRHGLAYWFYAFISPWLFRNRLITHDGLLSIKRGFTRKEWRQLLTKAQIPNYQIKWCWPFRWQIILWKE
ncbi:methyltransferase domain-containing protein [Legionella cardiaca]|uniref:Methyltransferase domain-containing protein n=1 Tax=Legionella cardiaca TaxID=1071983 RepID=A0ABY8AQK4_9GAMM|nr:methyltransferase domain-containing protein [Legionella cardiaca]WED42930.1 methyltransferase domain-containing protein [Legionella cardiaca]